MGSKSGWHHSQASKDSIRKANTGKDNSVRGPAISKALSQRPFSKEEWGMLQSTMTEFPWLTNTTALIHLSGVETSFGKVKKSRKAEIQQFLMSFDNKRFIPSKIQLLPKEKLRQLVSDLKGISFTKYSPEVYFRDKYNISKKEYCHLMLVIYSEKTTVFPRTQIPRKKQTYIEKFVMDILDSMKIPYQSEKYLRGKFCRVDIILDNNKVIEVNGTYHHADPRVYREQDLDTLQKANVSTFKTKIERLTSGNYQVLIIWQKDIDERPDWVIQELLNYIGGEYAGNKPSVFISGSLWD